MMLQVADGGMSGAICVPLDGMYEAASHKL